MSLKRNIIANYVSQFYVTLIGIFMVPMYVKYMGVEAYGLVGFFAMLQAWFQLLDMGLTPTLARETARMVKSSESDALQLRRLLRSLEAIFAVIALVGCAGLMLGADAIASKWLNVQKLPIEEVRSAVSLMAINIGLRWVSGLYRGAITGFERLVWLSGLNVLMATCRFVLVVPFFVFVGANPSEFFGYQLAVSALETVLLVSFAYRLLPKIKTDLQVGWQWGPLRALLKFSLSMAFANLAWVSVTQTDKLLLSRLLPLDEYARFSLATLMAGGVLVLSTPFSLALLPRLTRLNAEQDQSGLFALYREATQLVGVVVIPAVLVLGFFAEQVLWAWTGNADIAHHAAPVLTLYALGNGIVALGAFPYYLQYAKGDLRLHLIGTGMLIVFLVPAIWWGTLTHGAIGAGCAWVAVNASYFLFWLPRIHRRFASGLHMRWVLQDIGTIVLASSLVAVFLHTQISWPSGRFATGAYLLACGVILVLTSASASSETRAKIGVRWRTAFG